MFNNVGGKIKVLAKVICWVFIIVGCIGGIITAVGIGTFAGLMTGVVSAAFSVLLGWISTLALYGFGEVVENTSKIAAYMSQMSDDSDLFNRQ